MNLSNAINYLLDNAGASIQYRVKKEILKASIDCDEMKDLQAQILALPKIKKAFSCQCEDGFFGRVLHGGYFDGFDSTVGLLKRHGVELNNPNMQHAKESLINWTDYKKDHFYKAGNAMDEHGRGGFRAIWVDQLVELGADEATPIIKEQIDNALAAFRGALNYSCVDDFTKKATFRGKECRYYINGATFPAANHISILEKTMSWRSENNLDIVKTSFAHCEKIMHGYDEGVIYVNCGYFVGPFNYNWNAVAPKSVHDFDAHPIDFAWFMRELSKPKGKHTIFQTDIQNDISRTLVEWIGDNDFVLSIPKEQMRNFKNYASIEPSWRKQKSIDCDIYFPILLELSRKGLIKH